MLSIEHHNISEFSTVSPEKKMNGKRKNYRHAGDAITSGDAIASREAITSGEGITSGDG